MTRLNCVIGSASSMRAVVVQAVHHATHRSVFGGPLVDNPLMRNVLAEAFECLGGNGYVEDSGMPRRYREAPLNAVWDGSGNVNALDVLPAMTRESACVEAFFVELDRARGADAPAAFSDAFCANRLAGDRGQAFGTLPRGVDTAGVLERAVPNT